MTSRIGQLATATGVPTSTLRYYVGAGLLPAPSRTAAGQRIDPAKVIDARAGQCWRC